MAESFRNYINGAWVDSQSGRTFQDINPADRDDVIGTFPQSNEADVDAATEAAAEAFRQWRLMPAPKRGDILRIAGDILNRRKDEIARAATREMGKPVRDEGRRAGRDRHRLLRRPPRGAGSSATPCRASCATKWAMSYRRPSAWRR